VLEQAGDVESGNVEVKVIEVLAGEIDTNLLNFPFERRHTMFDNSGWDLIHPLDVGIREPTLGKMFIIYFSQEADGTYTLSSAGRNSIQEIISLDDLNVQALREITGH
jgi:hypothetical protein